MPDAVIVGAVRTPIGRRKGGLVRRVRGRIYVGASSISMCAMPSSS